MRRPTAREWSFLIEPLAWALLLPVIFLTLGETVFWVAAGGILLVHLVSYLRGLSPDAEATAEAPAIETPLDRRLDRLVDAVRNTPGAGRSLMVAVVVLARIAERHFGKAAFLVPVLLAGIVASRLASAYPEEDTDEDTDDPSVAGDPAEDGLTLPPPP